jgi:hypothetical protein
VFSGAFWVVLLLLLLLTLLLLLLCFPRLGVIIDDCHDCWDCCSGEKGCECFFSGDVWSEESWDNGKTEDWEKVTCFCDGVRKLCENALSSFSSSK